MNQNINDILDICLTKIKKGKSIPEVMSLYPEHQEELKELLDMACNLEQEPTPEISDDALSSCLIRVGEEIERHKPKERFVLIPEFSLPKFEFFKIFQTPQPAFAKVFASLLIIVFLSWSTTSLSANAIPGDILYPIKIVAERIQFVLTINPENKVELRLIFSEKRSKELIKHIEKNGKVDSELIASMMEEGTLALSDISKMSKSEKDLYLAKLEYLNAYQKDILVKLKSNEMVSKNELIDKAIQTCHHRMNWMKKMRHGEVPHGKWGPHCKW